MDTYCWLDIKGFFPALFVPGHTDFSFCLSLRMAHPRLAHKSSFWARSATVSAKRERAKARAGSYHTRPENQANDFEKV